MERPTVLVVEDDAGLRLALEHGLAAEGFDVAVASDAGTGCERAAAVRPDVVLLDWGLAEGDGGPAACERLREAHPHGHVVMLTGRSDAESERAALQAGARAFLVKGIGLGDLANELRRLLAAG
jgi:two-component system, OmpR family, KDP operon response regulator KdpE